jgi:hypothetical protein
MQQAASGTPARSGDRNDRYRALVSDLESLADRVRASLNLIESVVAGESGAGQDEIVANVVVLDDVTPRYLRAKAALEACNAALGVALVGLRDTRTGRHDGDAAAGRAIQPARLVDRA